MRERRKNKPAQTERSGGIRLQTVNSIVVVVVVLAAVVILVALDQMQDTYGQLRDSNQRYIACQEDAQDMMDASDYLTDQARSFAVTGERRYLNNYFAESEETQRRDKALASMEDYMPQSQALSYLGTALEESNSLMKIELYSMRLVIEAMDLDVQTFPRSVQAVKLSAADRKKSAQDQMALAVNMLFDDTYEDEKTKISRNVESCITEILSGLETEQERDFDSLQKTMHRLAWMIGLMLFLMLAVVAVIIRLIIHPLENNIDFINAKARLPMKGAFELRYLAQVYNRMYDENKAHSDRLGYEAVHDMLTGLYNRAGFEERYEARDPASAALILIDVDEFKGINDTYGHSTGDLILRKVADLIRSQFRAEDYVCRIGGDEFAVIMVFADASMEEMVRAKISRINESLRHPQDDLPPTSLSVGVAFPDRQNPTEDMFKDADEALYRVKRAGRNGVDFY